MSIATAPDILHFRLDILYSTVYAHHVKFVIGAVGHLYRKQMVSVSCYTCRISDHFMKFCDTMSLRQSLLSYYGGPLQPVCNQNL